MFLLFPPLSARADTDVGPTPTMRANQNLQSLSKQNSTDSTTIVKPRSQTPTLRNCKPTFSLAFSPPSAPLGLWPRHGVTLERGTARWRFYIPTAAANHPSATLHKSFAARNRPTATRSRPTVTLNRSPAARSRPPAARNHPPAARSRPPAARNYPPAARNRPPASLNRSPTDRTKILLRGCHYM